jgi:dipeptidyl-peptidase-4
MTAYALTHSTSFKIGIAGAPVTDWRLYDSIYTERTMGTPQNNHEGYDKTSVVKAAKNLSGKLLLIHGPIDDNVHLQNSMQFIYELEKAGKQFQFMVYPKSRHGVTDPYLSKHMREMMLKFILENL